MLGIFKTYSDVKKGIKDPAGLGQDMALDIIKAPLVLMTFLASVFFVVVGVVGFTELLGGPYIFFKVVFWLLIIPAGIIGLTVWILFGRLKRVLENARQKMSQKVDIMEAEVVKVDKDLTLKP